MTRLILASIAALSLAACATAPGIVLTPEDYANVEKIHPVAREWSTRCFERKYIEDCVSARQALSGDQYATPNMMAMLDQAIVTLSTPYEPRRRVPGLLMDVLAGTEQSMRSCYRSTCVTTTYRQDANGRVSDVRSY